MADKVGADLSLTINLGNYNSAKVSIWRETEILQDETEDQAMERIWEFVTKNVDQKVNELTEDSE